MDTPETCQQIETFLASHPNASPRIVAARLQLTDDQIAQALREADVKSFEELRERCRLSEAFRQLGADRIVPCGTWEKVRTAPRRIIPRTTVSYCVRKLWRFGTSFSKPCPLVDLSSGGLALLADSAPLPGKRVSLLLKFPDQEQALRLEGSVVYTIATGIAGYRHRIGIQFLPFANKRGCNSPKVLDALVQFESR